MDKLPLYGIWIDQSEAAADARALAGDPPDAIFFPGQHVTGADAISVAQEKWPRRHVVRIVEQKWVAK